MFCGLDDLLASTDDFRWTKDQMVNANIVFYKEYPGVGHMHFLIPAAPRESFTDML
jgi:hypothetical protein